MRGSLKQIVFSMLGVTATCSVAAAELRFTPTFGISEDFTDNADETASNRRRELLTVVQPGVALNYLNTRSRLDALYHLDYRYYAEKTRGNETSHSLILSGTFSLIQELLKLDVSDTLSRVSLDVARDTTAETAYHEQTDQNTATISPYLQWRFGEKSELKTGARYSDIRYWNERGIDRREAGAFAELNHQVSPRLGVTGRYVFDRTRAKSDTSSIDSYRDHNLSGGFRYEFAESSLLFGTIGNSWQIYSNGQEVSNLLWDVGISKQFGTSIATLESKRRYVIDPLAVSQRQTTYSFKVDRVLRRGTVGAFASYDEYAAADTGKVDRHGVTLSATGTHEIRDNLTSSLTLTGDKLSRRSSVDYPYRLRATGTILYAMGEKTSIDFTYTYATYRYHLDQGAGSADINRAIVQLRTSF